MTTVYAKAVEMAWRGMTPAMIAHEMGVKPHSVSGYLSKARKAGMEVPYFPSTQRQVGEVQFLSVALDCECVDALNEAAVKINRSGSALAHDILEAVLRDNLIDAVLDD